MASRTLASWPAQRGSLASESSASCLTRSTSQSEHFVKPSRYSDLQTGQNIYQASRACDECDASEDDDAASQATSDASFSSCDQGGPSGRPRSETRCARSSGLRRSVREAESISSRSLTVIGLSS